ncbi:MAG: hypothetical protein AB8G05_07870 [Oligoflexales bacterium]
MHKSPLITLKAYEKSRDIPNFLGIHSTVRQKLPAYLFQALSPHVMEWERGIWIFDLRFTKKFWQTQARIQGISGPAMIEQVLDEDDWQYIGIFAKHPWQLVYMLTEIKEQASPDKRELIHLQGPFGQSLLKQAGWPAWFAACKTLCAHWETKGSRQFKEDRLASKIRLLQASMDRLGVKGPNQLPRSTFESMKRRFGRSFATLWEWSLLEASPNKKQAQGLFTAEEEQGFDFPWILSKPPKTPKVKRHLEDSLVEWEHIEPLLKDDFDRLCQHEAWSEDERVCSLTWLIQLFHGKIICLNVNFRNPHSLHGEYGVQDTATQQARYAYESMSLKQKDREDDLDLPDEIPLVSWELTIKEKIVIPPKLRRLFKHFEDHKHPSNKLLNLENKLHTPLESYKLFASFDPMQAFIPKESEQEGCEQDKIWSIAASERPLYFYEQAQILLPSKHSFKFLERTSKSWWQEGKLEDRDYYLALEHKQQVAYWAFRVREQWYKHGIFS